MAELREYVGATDYLVVADRCDRCGPAVQAFAMAYVLEVKLFFCGHHFRKHRDALAKVATILVDETHKLEDTPCTL
jgi:hypothetical protein